MEFIKSSRDKDKLCFEGYMYTNQHRRPSGWRWIYVQRTYGCKGTVSTPGLVGNPVILTLHNHLPNQGRVAVAKARATMKSVAKTGVGKPNDIYGRVQQTLTNEERRILASAETCKRAIRHNLTIDEPDQPDTLANLVIGPGPNEWTETRNPTPLRFLLYDNGRAAIRRIVVYASDVNLEVLCDSDGIFMDGNFKCAPKLFMQLYVIHGKLGEVTVPLIYAFLERKDRRIYDEFFNVIVTECTNRNLNFAPTQYSYRLRGSSY